MDIPEGLTPDQQLERIKRLEARKFTSAVDLASVCDDIVNELSQSGKPISNIRKNVPLDWAGSEIGWEEKTKATARGDIYSRVLEVEEEPVRITAIHFNQVISGPDELLGVIKHTVESPRSLRLQASRRNTPVLITVLGAIYQDTRQMTTIGAAACYIESGQKTLMDIEEEMRTISSTVLKLRQATG